MQLDFAMGLSIRNHNTINIIRRKWFRHPRQDIVTILRTVLYTVISSTDKKVLSEEVKKRKCRREVLPLHVPSIIRKIKSKTAGFRNLWI